MMKKYKGSMLIEVLVSLMILMIAGMMAMTSILAYNKSKIRRYKYEEGDRIAYSIMNEIKYNYTYKELKDEILEENLSGVNSNSIGFRYANDILEKLTTIDLFQLEKGVDIKVEVIENNKADKVVKMKITIKLGVGREVIGIERVFNKSWWMEA